ncbi:hypothetical protein [Paenibacillus sp. D9]|uniref:hypothetical protein n=1 Tax=Paenibacillus TaxID=44249 RepID=UPI001E4CD198|nr:hypothetical protein [Paenibacillus sp. D9]
MDTLKQAFTEMLSALDSISAYKQEALPKMRDTILQFRDSPTTAGSRSSGWRRDISWGSDHAKWKEGSFAAASLSQQKGQPEITGWPFVFKIESLLFLAPISVKDGFSQPCLLSSFGCLRCLFVTSALAVPPSPQPERQRPA